MRYLKKIFINISICSHYNSSPCLCQQLVTMAMSLGQGGGWRGQQRERGRPVLQRRLFTLASSLAPAGGRAGRGLRGPAPHPSSSRPPPRVSSEGTIPATKAPGRRDTEAPVPQSRFQSCMNWGFSFPLKQQFQEQREGGAWRPGVSTNSAPTTGLDDD